MRETESVLQQFGEFLLKRQLVRQSAAPYFVRWVRQFLARQASDEVVADQVRHFCDDLERSARRAAGRPPAAGSRRSGSQLFDALGGAPARLGEHAEPSDVRHPVPVP